MTMKSRLRPLHSRLRSNALYDGIYTTVRPTARPMLPEITEPVEKTPAKKAPAKKAPAKKPAAKKPAPAKPAALTAAQKAPLILQGKTDIVKTVMDAGEYPAATVVLDSMLADEKTGTKAVVWDLKAQLLLSQAKHEELLDFTTEMTATQNFPTGHYYAAQSYFARGLYEPAMRHLQSLLLAEPNHADGVYLLCDLAQRTGRSEMARVELERLALVSRRPKTWLVMANLVETDADYLRMQSAWTVWTKTVMKNAYNKDAREYLALGAMRVGNYDLARDIWGKSLLAAGKRAGGFGKLNVRKPSYSSNRAETTLSDLNTTLRAAKIDMFLVSGTLLGCVRENKLLGHDKDIDVGIWSDVTAEQFFDVIHKSGLFMILSSRSEHIIRLKHLSGIMVDIFFHYRDPDDYWHAGVKMKWSNTPFTLVEREFLGQTHLIPEDYDTYLTENYGDWRTPMIAFDSGFDTPNGTTLNEDEMTIHAYKGLQNACISGTIGGPRIYLDDLIARGEGAFVERFCAHVAEFDAPTAAILDKPQEDPEADNLAITPNVPAAEPETPAG